MLSEKNTKFIYKAISDEKSKQIFLTRILFSLSGDRALLNGIMEDSKKTILSDERITIYHEELIKNNNCFYVFGCGLYARHMFELMPDITPKGFIDNSIGDSGTLFHGYPVYSMKNFLNKYNGEKVVISSKPNYFEMLSELERIGIDHVNIINGGVLWDIIEGRQYFDLPELPHIANEAFVDAGPLDGLSCVAFRNWCGDDTAVCYCFEPDERNRKKTEANLKAYGLLNYHMYESGLWDKKETLLFNARGMGESRVVEKGKDNSLNPDIEGIVEIPVVSMDEVLSDQRVTFIKMDIEGSELKALKGAAGIIKPLSTT